MESERTRVLLTVDEIERDQNNRMFATLSTDTDETVIIPLDLLPEGTRVGDVLRADFTSVPDEREHRRSKIAELQRRLFGSG